MIFLGNLHFMLIESNEIFLDILEAQLLTFRRISLWKAHLFMLLKLLEYVATRRPDWNIVLIGKVGEGDPHTDIAALEEHENITLLGPRPYSTLPAYIKSFNVAIIPAALNGYTHSMFPMKFLCRPFSLTSVSFVSSLPFASSSPIPRRAIRGLLIFRIYLA